MGSMPFGITEIGDVRGGQSSGYAEYSEGQESEGPFLLLQHLSESSSRSRAYMGLGSMGIPNKILYL